MKDLLIVGAGPAGLATAIAAHEAGLDYEVVEKGVLVNSIFHFPRAMTFFTTPELLEIGGKPFVTPYEKPTQWEALRYYRRVVDSFGLRIELDVAVTGLRREADAFVLTAAPRGGNGEPRREERRSRHVVIATGYYDHPNCLGIPGEDLPHVSHYYDEPHAYFRKDVVVVGGKNSAAIAALEIHRAGGRVTLVHRGSALADSIKYWIRPDLENRIQDGAIAARFETRPVAIGLRDVSIEGPQGRETLPADAVFLMTGYRPDTSLLREVGVRIEPGTGKPEHAPERFETNVPGVFVAGSVVAGNQTGRIFIETGRFHGEAIVRAILERRG